MAKKLSKKERDVLKIVKDPVLWVEEHIGQPRWYQQLVLRHPHHRTVLRMGRRLGKCIAGSQRVMDPISGRYLSIQEMYDKNIKTPRLYSLNDKTDKQIITNAFHIEDNGVKEVFEVKTIDGARVVLTGNHPVLTRSGWVEVDDLNVGDEIASPTNLSYEGSVHVNECEIEDWVYRTNELPEDIYEWTKKSLKIFLLTYIENYGVDENRSNRNEYYYEGTDLSFDDEEVAREFKHLFLRMNSISEIIEYKSNSSVSRNKKYLLRVKDAPIEEYLFNEVIRIDALGKEQTYDVHVPKTHNLVVEDLFVHNTWTMASHMLWVAMTAWGGRLTREKNKSIDILVVTPYEIQAKEIYDTLLEMIESNDALASSLKSNKQGPPREINFYNGSTIKLFTAGTSSSSNAASIRGQRADYVYLDKMLCPLYS